MRPATRGERALLVLFEESPEQVLRNMRSLGLDLRQWVEAGLLRIWAARPSAFGLETHLAILAELVEEATPSVAVLDGIASLADETPGSEVTSMVARKIDLLKAGGSRPWSRRLVMERDEHGERVVDGGHLAAAAQRRVRR